MNESDDHQTTSHAQQPAAAATAAPAPAAAAPAAGPPGRPDAIIFLPGLGAGAFDGPDQSVDGVAQRLASALDFNAADGAATFRLDFREQPYGLRGTWTSRVGTIYRQDRTPAGEAEFAVADIFRLDYGPTLTGRFERHNLLVRSFLALQVVVQGTWLLATSFRSKAKAPYSKLQLFYSALILGLVVSYTLLLLLTAVGTIVLALAQLFGWSVSGATTQSSSDPFEFVLGWIRQSLPGLTPVMVVLTALGVVLPRNWKTSLDTAAVSYLCALNYIRLGARKQQMSFQLVSLLDRIREVEAEGKVKYRRVILLGYSFGSILALDTLFPPGAAGPEERVRMVDTLVTIGCPVDLIRTFWPRYFSGRAALPATPQRWVNVYSSSDILGSNFRDGDDEGGDAQVGVGVANEPESRHPSAEDNIRYSPGAGLESKSLLASLTLNGFQVHSRYWGREPEGEINCFSDVVRALYRNDPALA